MFDSKLTYEQVEDYNRNVEIYQQIMLIFACIHTPMGYHIALDPEYGKWVRDPLVVKMFDLVRREYYDHMRGVYVMDEVDSPTHVPVPVRGADGVMRTAWVVR
jgi:hypothetical protein